MLFFGETLKKWFGFTRRERRSTFILLILILAIAGFRFVLPEPKAIIEDIPVVSWERSKDTLPAQKLIAVIPILKKPGEFQKTMPLININTCDSASLDALPGIGPVLSVRIIKYRNLLGGYASVEQLKEVYGLSEETFNLISARVYTDTLAIRKIKINSADYKELIRLPFFEKAEVTAILKYRKLKGKINGIDDLINNKLILAEKAGKIRPYLEFGE
jgi:DNA uptake protein ComE-like DNA-binding protein